MHRLFQDRTCSIEASKSYILALNENSEICHDTFLAASGYEVVAILRLFCPVTWPQGTLLIAAAVCLLTTVPNVSRLKR